MDQNFWGMFSACCWNYIMKNKTIQKAQLPPRDRALLKRWYFVTFPLQHAEVNLFLLQYNDITQLWNHCNILKQCVKNKMLHSSFHALSYDISRGQRWPRAQNMKFNPQPSEVLMPPKDWYGKQNFKMYIYIFTDFHIFVWPLLNFHKTKSAQSVIFICHHRKLENYILWRLGR